MEEIFPKHTLTHTHTLTNSPTSLKLSLTFPQRIRENFILNNKKKLNKNEWKNFF